MDFINKISAILKRNRNISTYRADLAILYGTPLADFCIYSEFCPRYSFGIRSSFHAAL